MRQISFWDENAHLAKLSELGDALERLNKVINWEMFRPKLITVFKKEPNGAGGRHPVRMLAVVHPGDRMGSVEH